MIVFANFILSEYACKSCANKARMRVAAAFAATNNFGALKLEAKLLKQQLFCSCF